MKTGEQLFDSINDPAALKRMGKFLLEENAKLAAVLERVRAERDEKEKAKQQWLDQAMVLNLHKLQRIAFGFGRELGKIRIARD